MPADGQTKPKPKTICSQRSLVGSGRGNMGLGAEKEEVLSWVGRFGYR